MLKNVVARKFYPKPPSWFSFRGLKTSNDAIIQMLTQSQREESNKEDSNGYRVRAFRTAIKRIQELGPIKNVADVEGVKGIGPRIRNRIQMFLEGKPYDEKTIVKASKEQQALHAALTSLPYFGPGAIDKLLKNGCKSIRDVRREKFEHLLKPKQRLIAKYYEHVGRPVSLMDAAAVMASIPVPKDQLILSGEHRRRFPKAECIMILIVSTTPKPIPVPEPGPPPDPNVLRKAGRVRSSFRPRYGYSLNEEISLDPLAANIVPLLEERGLIADTVEIYAGKWEGFVHIPEIEAEKAELGGEAKEENSTKLSGRCARAEICVVPQKSLGAALIHTTGDKDFNLTVKRRALKMGMMLNEFGLWKWIEDVNGQRDSDTRYGFWTFMQASDTEEGIFAELGMEYVRPNKRNYTYLTEQGAK